MHTSMQHLKQLQSLHLLPNHMLNLDIQVVKDHVGADFDDDATERTLKRLIKTADLYLKGSLGNEYPADDERAIEIALCVISDLYDNDGMTSKIANTTRKLINDFSMQLRLEMRKK